jgi:circadian clock protein KaiC
MLSLKQFLAGRSITAVFLDDHAEGSGDLHVQSIAHGVLTIEQLESDYGAERRRMRVNKLRGVNFVSGFHDATIAHGGMTIYPRLVAAEHRIEVDSERLSTGVAAFDSLVGGGLERGTSCLFLGPAGAGKSTLAIQFSLAAARRGERSLLCLFDESPHTLLSRCDSLGLSLREHVQSGLVELLQVDPAERAPGEFVHMIKERVLRKKVRSVLIDSLNGYIHAMSEVRFLNIQLHELLAFLGNHGVVTALTVAQHGIVGQMSSPVDLTYLADTVILLRYFEQEGRILKAISVVKKRIGHHENAIRELKLDSSGIRVGEPLINFRGVLTGVPSFHGRTTEMLPAS